ncbi:hypothetical protein OV203_18660 [Nannocystis sp. ILAH1]|uniref:hypothetical protein n=1 Tax=Nannocystis sp. ILAH1 TaxID=2996789 RepID=UPI00226E22AD|nr:hypothetical protein [Nannocystis sp. ILAH1]MCY0989166.1 hypothetical protein [Nannocystis sp. ILAH1]
MPTFRAYSFSIAAFLLVACSDSESPLTAGAMAGQVTGPCIEGQCLPGLMCFVDKCQPGGNNTQGNSSQPDDNDDGDTSSTGGTDPTDGTTGNITTAATNPTTNSTHATNASTTDDEGTTTTGPGTTGVDRTTGPSTSDWPSSDTETDSASFITTDSGDDSGTFIRPPEDACDGCAANQVCVVIDDIGQCVAKCDPLNQAFCGADNECVGVENEFACVPDASGNTGKVGDGCIYANGCDPGNTCLSGEYVANCNGQACCSAYCDTDLADPCGQYGMVCVAWYGEGEAPTGLEDVGVCVIP